MDERSGRTSPIPIRISSTRSTTSTTSPAASQLYADATNYINGINAYITAAKMPLNTLTMMPAEYTALGRPVGPQPFSLEDLVSIATLVGGIFGNGGGDQLYNAALYQNMAQKFGAEKVSLAGSPRSSRPRRSRRKHEEARPHAVTPRRR